MTDQRSGRLSIIPAEAVFDDRLSRPELRVLCALGTFADREGRCWPATTTLAQKLGSTTRQIRRSLRRLEEFGHVQTKRRPGQRSFYTIALQGSDPGHPGSGVGPDPGHGSSGDPGHGSSGVESNPGHPGSGGEDTQVPGTPDTQVPPNDPSNDPLNDDAARYAFEGQVIRLNGKDLETWRQRYHGIPDLEAELAGLDSWYAGTDTKKGKGWFHRAQRSLNEKHQERLAARQGSGGDDYDSDVIH